MSESLSKPKEVFGVLIGDYNFMAKDDGVFHVGSPPISGASISANYCSGSRQGQWMKHLASWTEVVSPFPLIIALKAILLVSWIGPLLRVRVAYF